MTTLCSAMSHPIEQKVREEYLADKTGNIYSQKINRSNALSVTKSSLLSMFFKSSFKTILAAMDVIFTEKRIEIRPGRKFNRHKRNRSQKSINYKPI